jgi:DnaJ-class molecular chaperone
MTVITWLERDRWSTAPRPAADVAVASSQFTTEPLAARYERQGSELVLIVTIRASEAEHGALVNVPAPGASVRLRVPPGTTSGRRFKLPRSNAPAPDGFGDLTVMVHVVG